MLAHTGNISINLSVLPLKLPKNNVQHTLCSLMEVMKVFALL